MHAAALILAAGEGTRMKSDLPKVAHRILGVPMVDYVVRAAAAAGADRTVVVTGYGADAVEALLADTVATARQDEQLGTGHAVMCAESALGGHAGSLLVLSGDSPLITSETLRRLVRDREAAGAAACVLTTRLPDPTGYGRVVRDASGGVAGVVEHKDCTPEELAIDEVNTGTYCFDAAVLFEHLHRLETDNVQGEYYLTDIVGILVAEGLGVVAAGTDDPGETLGVNSRVQLAEAAGVMQRRINTAHMLAGVTMTDPGLVWIGPDVRLGSDVVLEPMTFLMGDTVIGSDAVIGPSSRLTDCVVEDGAVIDSSVLYQARIGPGASVGPMGFIRPGTVLGERAKTGAFVEVKNARVGPASKIPHLSYIGDAEIGSGVNIGAGAITCNYDGKHKAVTLIGDGAFVGSDTMLVAPVEIGAGAVTGAGSVIHHDVPPDALAVERNETRTVEQWAANRRDRWKKE
jgi:bifunctional UDP-N-acetylglucosamine pyrophosphorylase/glucosamine-1-phosphate N-acetyltransferase